MIVTGRTYQVPGKKKKLSLNEAAEALARIAEKHLSKLPEKEQESRVAAFSRVVFNKTACQKAYVLPGRLLDLRKPS
jgi:hypothetical protein